VSTEERFYENLRLLTHSLSHYHSALTTGDEFNASSLSSGHHLSSEQCSSLHLGSFWLIVIILEQLLSGFPDC
ncbi:hypothetical protein Pmar_PMAR010217, partial [Perkinsus marinus ATCC 50983]